jgi:hypothetical protein
MSGDLKVSILFKHRSILLVRFKFRASDKLDSSDRLSGLARGAKPNQSSWIRSTIVPNGFGRVSQRDRVVGLNFFAG